MEKSVADIIPLQVEEVNQVNRDFYEYMEIPKDASTSDIRKAYRKMSLVLHPGTI